MILNNKDEDVLVRKNIVKHFLKFVPNETIDIVLEIIKRKNEKNELKKQEICLI